MKRISDDQKKMILNVIKYFENEGNGHHQAICKASDALKISKNTLYRLEKKSRPTDAEYKRNMSVKVSEIKTKIAPWLLHNIREVIYKMCVRKKHVTAKTVHAQLREEFPDFECSVDSVRRWMLKIGFKYKKENNRQHLMEQPSIRLKRLQFLDSYRKIKNENIFNPVFLDETWVFSKGSDRKTWQDESESTRCKKTGDGARYVVLHCGNSNGFVKDASLIFKANKKTGDYHDNMNSKNFENWFKTQLIPNLEEPTVIIMDNASYHSRLEEEIPRKSWTKKRLLEWLTEKGKEVNPKLLKYKIWEEICKQKSPEKVYHLDKYVESFGHQVLRLPPYHCHFNPIEMLWSEVKRKYDQEIKQTNGSPNEVLATWQKVVESVPVQNWKSYQTHTEKIIEKAIESELSFDQLEIEPFIINTAEDSSESDSDTRFSDSD